MLTTVEKVILLQDIDLFASLTSEQLSHIAMIAEEVSYPAKTDIYDEDGIPDSMFMVLEGEVRLHKSQKDVMIARQKQAFGTWALFDDEPRVVTASALDDVALLRIYKDDFIELLADNVQITQGIIKALSLRLRGLMARVSGRNA